MKPGPAYCTVQPRRLFELRPPGRLCQPTTTCPIPRVATRVCQRRGVTVGRPPPHADATDHLATSAPRAAHAAATSSCVSRLYPLLSCHVGAEFLFVSSSLASALLLPRELAVTTLFPTTPSSSEPRNQAPTFPSTRRTPLELTPWTSGPRASSSPATISSASPTTVGRRLKCPFDPVDPASSVARALRCSSTSPTEPTTVSRPPHQRTPLPDCHHRHDRALVSLPSSLAPNRDCRRPGLLPGRFPADQRLRADRIWPVSHRR
jgi:hypothetical protein